MTYVVDKNIEDVYTTEKEKNSFEYLQKSMDHSIARLVYEKEHIRKARDLYDGHRDADEFRYLQETFGLETPMAIKMTPLVKTRIDTLLGILLDETFTYKITMNDTPTLEAVEQEKLKEKVTRINAKYQEQIQQNIKQQNQGEKPQVTLVTSKYLDTLDTIVDEKFISSFEIAAQHLVQFFSRDITIDLKQKVKLYFLDLLVTGEAYWKTTVNQVGTDPDFEIVKPENIFFSKNTNNQFMSTGSKAFVNTVVRREYMRREDILNRWGHLMSKKDKEDIFGSEPSRLGHSNIVRSVREIEYSNRGVDLDRGKSNQYTRNGFDYIPVYFVEWLANNKVELTTEQKEDMQTVDSNTISKEFLDVMGGERGSGDPKKYAYRQDRYEGIRIGDVKYLNCGKSKNAPRSIGNPWQTCLSYNGVGYNERNGIPYSLAWSLKDLQDSYDIMMFFRDNIIANSGVKGSRINLAAIPKVLGTTFMERLLKFMALKKQGVELIDPTEDGASLFQHYGDFDSSLDGNTIVAINAVLETIQSQADIVSGVNRHMYQAAEVKDAVSNVKMGQKVTSLITKDLFELVYVSQQYMLVDLLNRAKYTYKKGKRGSYIVGARSVLFDIMPEDFCFTDYNIQLVNSSSENMKVEKLSGLVPELVKAGAIDPDLLVKMVMSDSTTEVVNLITDSMREKKEENDQIGQLTGQVDELTQQSQQLQKELEKTQQQLQASKDAELDILRKQVEIKAKLAEDKTANEKGELERKRKKDASEVEKDKAIVQLEREQLYATEAKGNSREVRNDF